MAEPIVEKIVTTDGTIRQIRWNADYRAKLGRAENLFEALRSSFQAYRLANPYAPRVEADPTGDGCLLVADLVNPLPGEWNLQIGDIIHNLRSALDALTYNLAVKNLGREPTLDEVREIQFVIVDNREAWKRAAERRLRHLGADAVVAIEGLQPFNYQQPHQLSILRELSNIDKHRRILVTGKATGRAIVRIPRLETSVNMYIGEFKDHIILGGYPADASTVKRLQEATIDINFRLVFTEQPAHGISVFDYLVATRDLLRDMVFPVMERFL